MSLSDALAYAAKGWRVFPLLPNSKLPATPHGCKDATTDSKTIQKLFAKPCNLGIATGHGLVVIDLDVKPGRNGIEAWKDLCAPHPAIEPFECLTPSSGRHLYFQTTAAIGNSASKLGLGIDVRGEGGYVVAPPSSLGGTAYCWEFSNPPQPPELPAWLLALLIKPKKASAVKEGIIPLGRQDDELHKLACSLVRQGLRVETVKAGLRTALLACPQDPTHPFTETDIERWVHGAQRLIEETPEFELPHDNKGRLVCNADAALRILEQHPVFKEALWFDTFQHRLLTRWNSEIERDWHDEDTQRLLIFMQRDCHLARISKSAVEDALSVYATRTHRHIVRDWCQTLTWDGVTRMERCFSEYFGSPETPYIQSASKNFWLSLAARIYRPGCQADHMVVLEGPQGIGKTSALRVIGSSWYLSLHVAVGSLDFYQLLPGKLVVEIAELDAFRKQETTRIKQAISTTVDSYRKSYGRVVQDYPRQCIFVGSTNESWYLHDPTGARRFWPVPCGKFDLIELRAQREQLFAEAVARFKKGETWHQMPEETAEEQEARRQADSWEDPIREFLAMKEETTLREVLCEALAFPLSRIARSDEYRVAHVMRHLGWTVHIRKDAQQKSIRRWVTPPYVPGEDAEISLEA